MHYASDWKDTKRAIRLRDRDRCMNCRASGEDVNLDVHHVVPRSAGGADRMSNLILLCRQCHDAAHGSGKAPTVDFESSGDMEADEFDLYRTFFNEIPSARFDESRGTWEVPAADMKLLLNSIDDLPLSPSASADNQAEAE